MHTHYYHMKFHINHTFKVRFISDLNPLGLTDVDFQAPEGSAPFLNKLALLFNQKNTRKGNNSTNDKKSNKIQFVFGF